MTKKTKIVVGCVVLLLIVCGIIWWFMPVHFLREVEPEEVATIIVFNGNNGDDSQIADNTDQTNTGENGAISAEEAKNILREYLISVNRWESNYVLEPLDPVLGKIENEEIFKFEIRYTDDTDEVGGRLIDNYVITTDGERIFWYNPADNEWVEQILENVSTEGVADYPAAIMVNDTIYLVGGTPMPTEVDESAIIGYTELFTETFPENNGETNFNPELGMPYAHAESGIAVLYQNEWYLCTPFSDTLDETETICEKTAANLVEEESNNRIIVQRNVKEMEMDLTVYLEDGTSATIHYPMDTEKDYAYCETAYLQYDNKESIVLEIVNGTSNYGAAEYHVLHAEKENGEFVIIEDATVLGEQPLTGDRYAYSLIGFVGNVSMIRAEDLITSINGKPAVRFVDWDSGKKEG